MIGDSNRLAHAAALAVAELPGLAYNPLFICGPPGLGKTHLLHSIANYVAEHGAATVRYTTAESFTNHFLGALHGRDIDAFKAAYRGVDVLLVDDVQFLQAKAKTEQEFFHTFNALHAGGAQLVLTSDRLPRDLDAMESRLRERFEAGLVCDIHAPDPATRLTILRKRVLQDELRDVAPEALAVIAGRVSDNVRALEGALVRVVAFGSLTGRPVTAALATEVLDGLYPESGARRRTPTVREIQEHTASAFGISRESLVSPSRAARRRLAASGRDVPRARAHRARRSRRSGASSAAAATPRCFTRTSARSSGWPATRRRSRLSATSRRRSGRRLDAAAADRLRRLCAHAPCPRNPRSMRLLTAVVHTPHTPYDDDPLG